MLQEADRPSDTQYTGETLSRNGCKIVNISGLWFLVQLDMIEVGADHVLHSRRYHT